MLLDFRLQKALDVDTTTYAVIEIINFYAQNPASQCPGWCELTQDTIAALINSTPRSVQRSLLYARQAGLIENKKYTSINRPTSLFLTQKHKITSQESRQFGEIPTEITTQNPANLARNPANLANYKYNKNKFLLEQEKSPNYFSIQKTEILANYQNQFEIIQKKHHYAIPPNIYALHLDNFFYKINLKGYGPEIDVPKIPKMFDRYLTNVQLNNEKTPKKSFGAKANSRTVDAHYFDDLDAYQ
jgi:hypothetical protein